MVDIIIIITTDIIISRNEIICYYRVYIHRYVREVIPSFRFVYICTFDKNSVVGTVG